MPVTQLLTVALVISIAALIPVSPATGSAGDTLIPSNAVPIQAGNVTEGTDGVVLACLMKFHTIYNTGIPTLNSSKLLKINTSSPSSAGRIPESHKVSSIAKMTSTPTRNK